MLSDQFAQLRDLHSSLPDCIPDSIRKDAADQIIRQTIPLLIQASQHESPLVRAVLAGKTTFTAEVTPLAELNKALGKWADQSPQQRSELERMGREISERFNGILDFKESLPRNHRSFSELIRPLHRRKFICGEILQFIICCVIWGLIGYALPHTPGFILPLQGIAHLLCAFTTAFIVSAGFEDYADKIEWRKIIADQLLADARLLDEMFALAK
jgi:hypothetical protein